ncbi:hypothetical protein Tco_0005594 [Tanacetum coccineum]
MPIPLGSFDAIIRMDWLTKYHGVIIYDEKIVRVPYGGEMDVTSFWHTSPQRKPKTSRRRSDLRTCRLSETSLKFFLKTCRVPGAAPVARAPYRLAPSEMKELAEQL